MKDLRPVNRNVPIKEDSAGSTVQAVVFNPELSRLPDLIAPNSLGRDLRSLLACSSNVTTPGVPDMALALRMLARHHAALSDDERAQAQHLHSKLILPRTFGLAEKNRKRLMPFNDAGLTDRFLSLAQELWITAKACRNPSARTRQRESAIALEMLTLCPIRRNIFAAIHVDRDPQRHGPGYPEWGEA